VKQLFLHGLGQSSDSWRKTLSVLDNEDNAMLVDLKGLIKDKAVTYDNIYESFSEMCNQLTEQIDLCGLSLGGILALNYAIDYPERVRTLVLIAAQYKMPKMMLRVQNQMFKFMQESKFSETGFQKPEFIQLCKTMLRLDFSNEIHKIYSPSLVIYGEKDKANKKAAIELAKHLKRGKLSEIKGSGHEVNVDAPEALGELLSSFYSLQNESECKEIAESHRRM